MSPIKNRGTGAGGSNTTLEGGAFERFTDNETKLKDIGFEKTTHNKKNKTGYFLSKEINGKKIVYVKQHGFKSYMKKFFNIMVNRQPDEAYIINTDGAYTVKILEKKMQNRTGTTDVKLWAAPALKKEYEEILNEGKIHFDVSYGFSLSPYFADKFEKKKNYKILKKNLTTSDIPIFFGNDADYYDKLLNWIVS
jgi:hypothetical protein